MRVEDSNTRELKSNSELFQEAIDKYYDDAKPGSVKFMALADFVSMTESNFKVQKAKEKLKQANGRSDLLTQIDLQEAITFSSTLDVIIIARENSIEGYSREAGVVESAYYHLALFISQEQSGLPHFPKVPDAANRWAIEVLSDKMIDLINEHENSDNSELMVRLQEIDGMNRNIIN